MWRSIQVFQFFLVWIIATHSLTNNEPLLHGNMSIHLKGKSTARSKTKLTPSIISSEGTKEIIKADTLNCGGILEVTVLLTTYYLQYKPFETASANERCVWIIRATNANYAYVLLEPLSNIPPAGTLSVLGLGTNGQQTSKEP